MSEVPDADAFPSLSLPAGVMISWRNQCYHSDALARFLGVPHRRLPGSERALGWRKAVAYLTSGIGTLRLLQRDHPDHVVCINLPPFVPLLCWLYCHLTGARLILDFHSGALLKRQWALFKPLYRLWVRFAWINVCHNRTDQDVLSSWGGRTVLIPALPQPDLLDRKGVEQATPTGHRPFVLVVASFSPDEPIDVLLAALKRVPNCDFAVSGDYRRAGLKRTDLPGHIRLAGYLTYRDYLALMAKCDAMISLSTRADTMQMAVEEAMSLGTPVITNDSSVLQDVLGDGALFTAIETDAIARAICTMLAQQTMRRHAIIRARRQVLASLKRNRATLQALMEQTSPRDKNRAFDQKIKGPEGC